MGFFKAQEISDHMVVVEWGPEPSRHTFHNAICLYSCSHFCYRGNTPPQCCLCLPAQAGRVTCSICSRRKNADDASQSYIFHDDG